MARTIKIYVRSLDNVKVGIYAFNRYGQKNDTWGNYEAFGTKDEQWSKMTTETLGGHTWYVSTYETNDLKAINSNPAEDTDIKDSYFSIQFHNEDNTWTTEQSESELGWGIKNDKDNLDRLPDELFFVIDHNAVHTNTPPTEKRAKGEDEWLGIHEITRAQADLTENDDREFNYYLMDANGNRIATFDAVRNQNQGIHSMSGNSFAATVWADKLFTNNATTAKFYIKAYYKTDNTDKNTKQSQPYIYTEVTPATDYEYRPLDDSDITPDGNATGNADKDWKDYGDCVARVSDPNQKHFFTVTKKAGSDGKDPVSYTVVLNTANYFDSKRDGSAGNQSVLTDGTIAFNPATNNSHTGVRSIGLHPNKNIKEEITVDDDNPLYVISNMQNVLADYSHNRDVDADDHNWDLKGDYPMKKVSTNDLAVLIKDHPLIGEEGDEVWTAKIFKPGQSELKSIFMAFVSKADLTGLQALTDASTDDERTTAWNKVIRPFVAEGKDAISSFGGLYRPVYLANGNQALSPGADDMFYTQCNVYVNLTKSTFFVDPVSSYEITGPAVNYFDPVHKTWNGGATSEENWGNGEASYWATPMAYNAEENCWEYTGKFFRSMSYAETKDDGKDQWIDKFESNKKQWDGTEGTSNTSLATQNETENGYLGFLGFRFLTNHLYTINYREDYDRPTATTHHEGLTAYWDGTSTDKTGHEDTYYYNHVDIDPDVNTTVQSMSSAATIKSGDKANNEKVHNINFSLPDGVYTIRFYPDGDGKDNHSFYKLIKGTDPGTNVPVGPDDPISKKYKFLRTYSDTKSHSLASDQKCFIVTAYDHENHKATLTSIPYIPANTGVILTYNETEIDKLVASGKAKQVADGIWADLKGYLVLANLDATDSISYATDTKYADLRTSLDKNMLRPTTYRSSDGSVTNGNFLLEASTFTDNTEKEIAYRNYNFSYYKKKTDTTYKLGFYRIKNKSDKNPGMTSPNRAYLQLPGNVSGGTTPTLDWDANISYSTTDALAKAQIFNTFDVDYPEWGNGDVNGIAEVNITETAVPAKLTADSPVYDIAGRKVTTVGALNDGHMLPKGLYIVNGRKFVIR
ncbi:MAG: hypothetical protein SPM31_08950 [Prevotella sp.]|nr:hypothetical protein [Prevotella sp.]